MLYKLILKDVVAVEPKYANTNTKEAVLASLKKEFLGYNDRNLGSIVEVIDVLEVGVGKIMMEDSSIYFEVTFEAISFRPDNQEIVKGYVRDIVDFGVFLNIGAMDGMIHLSQTMADFVSFSQEKVIVGKDTKQTLKVGDICIGKIIAISYRDINNPKIGLTMRQPYLGALNWLKTDDELVKSE
ncbi:MAG: DNA-directed RNA polymerase [Candidatus Nanoarchaeia archaeon]|nr:DNA-directed RNA polymerase [Candidatus Nanoarchaeia archaeon]